MRASGKLFCALAVGALSGLLAVGCQTYDFEPVDPLGLSREDNEREIVALNLKPHVMLLVDKSGSMDQPVDPSRCSGEPGSATCPSRWSDLQAAMQRFLTGSSTGFLKLGLTAYPRPDEAPAGAPFSEGQCSASKSVLIPVPGADVESEDALRTHAGSVWDRLNLIKMENSDPVNKTEGGTPTALSLRFLRQGVAELQGTDKRQKFVILLTDGLPNCNPEHAPFDPEKPEQCVCSNPAPGACTTPGNERLLCYDPEGSVAEINALRQAGVTTIVVGFGADTAGAVGGSMLQDMGRAGGFVRTCEVDADCGSGQTCSAKVCDKAFFQTGNEAELSEALAKIARDIQVTDPCKVTLATQPSDPRLLSVRLNRERLPDTDPATGKVNWVYVAPAVELQNDACARVKASTPDAPVTITVSVIESR